MTAVGRVAESGAAGPVRRVGLIVPSSNPTIEGFLQRVPVAALLGLEVLVTRVRVRRVAADAAADAQFDLIALRSAARLLADAEVPLLSWAGTSGFWLGGEREDMVLAGVSAAVGVPVVSSRLAVLSALAENPGVPVGVLTPYLRDIHDRVVAAVAAMDAAGTAGRAGAGGAGAGGKVVADRGLGIERNLDFAAIPEAVLEDELRRLAGLGAESLAVVCTNVLGILPGLADAPFLVVDSVLATLWHAARLTGACGMSYADCYRQACARLRGQAAGLGGAG